MLTIKECRKYLKNKKLTDKQIEIIRNFLYKITERIIEKDLCYQKNK